MGCFSSPSVRAGGEDAEQMLMRCSRAEVSGPESLWLMVDVNAVFAGPRSSDCLPTSGNGKKRILQVGRGGA